MSLVNGMLVTINLAKRVSATPEGMSMGCEIDCNCGATMAKMALLLFCQTLNTHEVRVPAGVAPSMVTVMNIVLTQRSGVTSMGSSECTEFPTTCLTHQLRQRQWPPLWSIRRMRAVWSMRQVVVLADVDGSTVMPAVRRMVTKWFHAMLCTLVDLERGKAATISRRSQPHELVLTTSDTILALQEDS